MERMREGSAEKEVVRQPLLGITEESSKDVSLRNRALRLREEAKQQILIAWPMIVMGFLRYGIQTISVMFVGHLGELALSSASIATSFCSVTGFTVMTGMASALETLCGQAFGAKQYRLLGFLLHRAIFALLCTSIPLSMLWIFMENILVGLGQDPSIAHEAGKYARWMTPALFAYAFLRPLINFLQAHSLVMPMMFSSAITLVLHAPLCWFLVFRVGLGDRGAALANAISHWFNTILLLLYVRLAPACNQTWAPISRDSLQGLVGFLKLAIPSAAMICLEYWSFEMLILLSGILPNPELEMSILSICVSTLALAYTIPLGLGGAASTRVSNELGAGRTEGARLAVGTGICLAVLESIVVGSTFFAVRNIWGHAYSDDQEVTDYVAVMMPILAVSTSLDSLQAVLSGIARGCGWQKIGAYANLGAYYIVGIPTGVVLAFVLHLGGKGLFLGILCGLLTQTVMLAIIAAFTDWSEQEKKARKRVNESTLPIF